MGDEEEMQGELDPASGRHDVLRETGLSRDDLADLLARLDQFMETLTYQQRRALQLFPEASRVLQRSVAPGHLEAFITTRTEGGVLVTLKKIEGPGGGI